jgi:hypothetical protein
MFFWNKIRKIKTIADCIGSEKGKTFLVIGAGGTLREYSEPIKAFIDKYKPLTIAINKMTDFHVPDYHLWTNSQRWEEFGGCISEKSKMMFGSGLPSKLIKKHFTGKYIKVDYAASLKKASLQKIDYKKGFIYGNYRTAGCLAIMIAHLLGASEIFIVGMDGFTLHKREDVEKGLQNQHVYGKGFTDDASWEECVEKDRLVYENLQSIENFGINFRIITPTVFEKFYKKALE